MKRKGFYIAVGILAVIVLNCSIYVFTGTKNTEKLMWSYLEDKGYTGQEIQSIDVNHSFLNTILSYNEWIIHVRYADEPDAVYIYTVKNGQIKAAGVSGSVDKEKLKHKE
ncbi:MAG: DUF3139 domain-containing protein [Firmicutes bacterium]|nr:DUF3139 domain-containing protein [Bacillota bacterium]